MAKQKGSESTIPVPPGHVVPPKAGFTPDRLGVRKIVIDIDRDTGAYRTSMVPCPATADGWGPNDLAEVVSPDLLAELTALPASPLKTAALAAIPQVVAGLIAVAAAVIDGRDKK